MNGLDSQQSGQFTGGYLAIAVHQYDQRVPLIIFHDQSFDDTVFVHSQAVRAVSGATMLFVSIRMYAEGDLLVPQESDRGSH